MYAIMNNGKNKFMLICLDTTAKWNIKIKKNGKYEVKKAMTNQGITSMFDCFDCIGNGSDIKKFIDEQRIR